jgi:folate-binding protein YgfZ
MDASRPVGLGATHSSRLASLRHAPIASAIIENSMMASVLTDKLPTSARFEDYRGVRSVGEYTDARAEFEALKTGCGLIDLSWRAKVIVTGSDRVRWMNGMVTNNVRDLAPGVGVYSFLLNPQGKIQGDLYVHNRDEYLLVDTDQSQVAKIIEIFEHYIIMDDVEVADAGKNLSAIYLQGPESRTIATRAGLAIPELEPLHSTDTVWQQVGITALRTDNPVVEGYEIWLSPENVASVWKAIESAGATAVGTKAFELFRIACGIPCYGVDIREKDLPQETEQVRALNFNKGCYVGQEIVERIRSRGSVHRIFTGFKISAPSVVSGAKLHSSGKDVGEITSVANIPSSSGELDVALGYVRRENGKPGTILEADGVQATVTEVPFQDIFQS